ncbi:TonB-dependent receptor domain-containing protein, partial [Shewanella indica]|uniref:TonB-dependent receptor domain-containing protein n=1 Tax=Shewanella indica TaxID=768528 RepID=UPI00207B811B
AEEGESLTLGFVWNVTDDWSIETSYYDISYDNKIEVVDVDDLIREEIANGGSQYIVRGSDGKIETIHSQYRNLSALETSGFDFVTSYNQETDFGDFRLKLEMTHVLDYKTKADAESDFFDEAGLQDLPQWRGSASVNWTRDNWSAAWTTYYIGSQDSGAV